MTVEGAVDGQARTRERGPGQQACIGHPAIVTCVAHRGDTGHRLQGADEHGSRLPSVPATTFRQWCMP